MFYEIKTFTLPVIEIDDDVLVFRVEITQKDNQYFGQLLRREIYRLKPTYAPEEVVADEEIYVLDYHTIPPFEQQVFNSIDDCLNYAHSYLQDFFNQKSHK
ncbi:MULTISPECIES: hypothetical protein [Neisseria]|nr:MULTISPECIES: hypothetical protein [Neisseria]UOO83862.1 hypothetical protein LVJ88_09190 [Neisseria dumasiana]